MTVRRSSITQTTLEASWIGCGIHRFCALKGCFEISDYSSFISRVISKRLTSKKLMQIKKVLGLAVLVAAFAFVGASSAHAATAQELQDQINALLAQISSLQGGSSSTSCYSFTRDLTVGSQGADVTALQNYLAAGGYFKVAATGYFGSVTAQAVSAWQSAAGVSPAAGYFGAISRAKYNSTCSSTSGDDDDNSGNGGFNTGNGEEASLEKFDTKSGDDTDLEEGQEDGEVLDFKFDVKDSDVEVQRVQVNMEFMGTASGEDKPWKAFTDGKLLVDGDEVASVDLSDEDNWDDEGSDEYSFRFNGVDEVVSAGDTAKFTLALSVEDSVDGSSSASNNEWKVSIDTDSVRALDEAGIDQYVGDSADTVTMSIEEAGGNDELNISESDNDPEATVLELNDNSTSDWLTVGVAQLSAEGDIQLNELPLVVTVSSSTYNALINDAQLVIDGQEYSDFTVSGGGTTEATLTFDLSDEDVVINDGEDVDAELQLEFNELATGDEGTTLEVTATSGVVDAIDAEGASSGESLDTTQLTGSYDGETHTLRTSGIMLSLVDTNAVAPVGDSEAQANYEVEFTVEAFGDDFYIEKSAARDASADKSDGVEFVIENGSNTEYSTTTVTVTSSLTKDGSTSGDTATHFKVAEGQSRTFHLLVTLDNSGASAEGAGYYRVQFTGVGFDADGSGVTADYLLSTGLENFETDTVYVADANI